MPRITEFDRHKIRTSHQQGDSKGYRQTNWIRRCGIQAVLKTFQESGEVKDNKRTGRPRIFKIWWEVSPSFFFEGLGGSPAWTWLSIWQLYRDAKLHRKREGGCGPVPYTALSVCWCASSVIYFTFHGHIYFIPLSPPASYNASERLEIQAGKPFCRRITGRLSAIR